MDVVGIGGWNSIGICGCDGRFDAESTLSGNAVVRLFIWKTFSEVVVVVAADESIESELEDDFKSGEPASIIGFNVRLGKLLFGMFGKLLRGWCCCGGGCLGASVSNESKTQLNLI